MPKCPGNQGCKGPCCYGLREYMLDLTGKDYGLPATRSRQQAQPTRVVELPCRSMTCQCDRCKAERTERRARDVPQPWHPRKAA